ncbi:MAG: pyruvate carboxylase, partial [Verrucomicrobia bacterium]|nr:pyruvate carboxylase [Verrucomicrobiota bacterium]
TTPELFDFKPRRDRASRLLNFLAEVTVNGNPHLKAGRPQVEVISPKPMSYERESPMEQGTRDLLLKLGPKGFSQWVLKQKRLLVTDTTFRDAHQSLMATRMRTHDMLGCADFIAHHLGDAREGLFSMEMWGGATFDTAMRFLSEDPWERLRILRKHIPNICFQMLFRGSNAVGYSNYPDNVVDGFVRHAAEAGMDIFRVFDSLNYLPNLKTAMEAVQQTHGVCEAALCYTGNILDGGRDKFDLAYYVKLAKELERMGAHMLAIKDMAGLCRPAAARKLVRALKQEVGIPIHFHTHETAGVQSAAILEASQAGVDVVDLAVASMSGSTSQPNMNSLVAALESSPRRTRIDLDALNKLSDYWEQVREVYQPFDTAPKTGSADVYLHEMPGGQYTNLKAQAASMGVAHRWNEIARTYAEVNLLFGDIVKVTPSSKVVGDMALYLFTHGIRPNDVVNLSPEEHSWPESVIDMFQGGLGWPEGGWPEKVWKAILPKLAYQKARKRYQEDIRRGRPKPAPNLDLEKVRKEITQKIKRKVTDDDLYAYLMYPKVFLDFQQHHKAYGKVGALPTLNFLYGIQAGEEIQVSIEEGKDLFIRLITVGSPDEQGQRTVTYELNGIARDTMITDAQIAPKGAQRAKADDADPSQIGAPIPGLIAEVHVRVGQKVQKGERLIMMEAMKMQTSINAPADGTISNLAVAFGDHVEIKDLLIQLS